MTSDDAAKGGSGGGENKGTADKSEMPPNEANPGAAATAAAAAAEAPEANGGKDAPSAGAANADVEAGKILEQDGVGKVEFTSSKAEEAKKVNELSSCFPIHDFHPRYVCFRKPVTYRGYSSFQSLSRTCTRR